MGMALLGNLAAYDFGYVSVGTFMDRTGEAFKTMEELPRHRGHFHNWYDTRTLQPAPGRYVSTADSGNLASSLITLQAGLAELAERPILQEKWRDGLEDTAGILLEELERASVAHPHGADITSLRRVRGMVVEQMASLAFVDATLLGIYRALSTCVSVISQMEGILQEGGEPAYWLCAMRRQCADLRTDLACLAPWLENGPDQGPMQPMPPFQDKIPSLRDLAGLALFRQTSQARGTVQSGDSPVSLSPGDPFVLAAERAAQRIAALEDLATRCGELSEMDLDFLYDPTRKLLSIGYNVDTHRRDPGYYDLLASEARLCSFVGIARGQLPIEHWFHLGRQLAPGGRAAVLVSWSGSMFEYLMPLLLMPTYEATLLQQSCREAVRRQVRYGLRHGTPWGISESCYNQIDVQRAYQYRAFGVPGLGLKRGLHDDLVVAPYASALALMIEPSAACGNLQAMARQGFLGRYGFYEATDYTPGRLPSGKEFALVRTHMAHHSGMSLLSLAYALVGQPMQRRFLSDPRIRASLLLLQERIPVAEVRTRIDMAPDEPGLKHATESIQTTMRSFTTANSPVPEVHLLSNGRYHVMITTAGGGSSRWEDLALTRWQEDATRDHWGTFLYIRDLDTGTFWSATAQPTCKEFDRYEAAFSQGVAEFHSVREKIEVHTRVAVSSEDDVELRRVVITNLSGQSRNLEITSYAEVVLLNGLNACEQPAFNGLFVQTETLPSKAAILCIRRSKWPQETWPLFFHGMIVHDVPVSQEVSFETDRSGFLGRGRTAADPAAMSGELSGTCGPVLDPVMAIRRTLHLAPGQSVTVDAVWGVAQDRPKALSLWTGITTTTWPTGSSNWHRCTAKSCFTNCRPRRPTPSCSREWPMSLSMPIPACVPAPA